jgi:hypothetical protein
MSQRKDDPKISRGQLGAFLSARYGWPIGLDRYADFKKYSRAAARHGYVTLGLDSAIGSDSEWIKSTGRLENACGGEAKPCSESWNLH